MKRKYKLTNRTSCGTVNRRCCWIKTTRKKKVGCAMRTWLFYSPCWARTSDIMINSRLNKMYIAFTASIMSDFCGNNRRYGDNGIPFSTLSPHSTKFHASFRASIFCVFSEMRTNVIRKVAHMLYLETLFYTYALRVINRSSCPANHGRHAYTHPLCIRASWVC